MESASSRPPRRFGVFGGTFDPPHIGHVAVARQLAETGDLDEVVWCQEEPQNMGARNYLHPHFTRMFADGPPLRWECRPESASPATGSPKAHRIEQADLLARVFESA